MTLLAIPLFATYAYTHPGPGAGLTFVGNGMSVGAAMLLAIAGFLWYPVRRLLRV